MTRFIAEVGSNHNGSLSRAKDFIWYAESLGCWGVKFQLFKLESLFAPGIKPHLKNWELPVEWLPELSVTARRAGLKFGCTPLYLDAVNELEPYVDFYKISSYELVWDELLLKIAEKNKPVILSTGMANQGEIEHALELLKDCYLTLLHCVSLYPTPAEQASLGTINWLKKYKYWVGYSDHTGSPGVIYNAALKYEAETIEFHLDIGGGWEYGPYCWLPSEIGPVIKGVNMKFLPSEDSCERQWRRDSDGLRPMKEIR